MPEESAEADCAGEEEGEEDAPVDGAGESPEPDDVGVEWVELVWGVEWEGWVDRGGGCFDGLVGHCWDNGVLVVEGQCGIFSYVRRRGYGRGSCGAGLKGRWGRGRRVGFGEDDLF